MGLLIDNDILYSSLFWNHRRYSLLSRPIIADIIPIIVGGGGNSKVKGDVVV
jgi:hypothetical protein